MKTYQELMSLPTYDERLNYLKIFGDVGVETFGFDRYINQKFYTSNEWRRLRQDIIFRDKACDLGIEGFDIIDSRSVIIHHINPITIDDFKNGSESLLNPNNLITTTKWTHRLIHYGNDDITKTTLDRKPFDTCPWRK